jgi:hypothetical protein
VWGSGSAARFHAFVSTLEVPRRKVVCGSDLEKAGLVSKSRAGRAFITVPFAMTAIVTIFVASGTAHADQATGVIPAEPAAFDAPPPGYRETCTSISWGFDGFRSECRVSAPWHLCNTLRQAHLLHN